MLACRRLSRCWRPSRGTGTLTLNYTPSWDWWRSESWSGSSQKPSRKSRCSNFQTRKFYARVSTAIWAFTITLPTRISWREAIRRPPTFLNRWFFSPTNTNSFAPSNFYIKYAIFRSYSFDMMIKQSEKMVNALAICLVIYPKKIDEIVQNVI